MNLAWVSRGARVVIAILVLSAVSATPAGAVEGEPSDQPTEAQSAVPAPVSSDASQPDPDASQTDAAVFEGRLIQVMESGSSDSVTSMVEVDGQYVAIPDDVVVTGTTGDEVAVTVEASVADGAEAAEAAVDDPSDIEAVEVTEESEEMLASDSESLVILPVYWSGGSGPTATTEELATLVDSVADYWTDQSQGVVSLTSEVKAWRSVSQPASCSNADMLTWWSQVLTESGLTDVGSRHAVVFFPTWASCEWGGLASVGGNRIWVNGYTAPELLSHEFGHNLGLGHANRLTCGNAPLTLPASACTNTEYGNVVDVMGSGPLTGSPGNLNIALADYLGFADVVQASPGHATTATIYAIGSFDQVRGISIPISGGTIYIDYRPYVAPDTRRAGWAGVEVHLLASAPGRSYPNSYLLDMHPATFSDPDLGVGEKWAVPGTDLTVTVNSANSGVSANITVAPADRTPVGAWDSLTGSSSSITATGWTFDPDTSDPISVHAYVDGRWSGAFTADGVRNDVGAIFGNGSLHGFQITVSASSGPHQVCLYAINTPSGGTNPQLGCRSVTVTNRTPVGAWDSLTGSSSSITATGWTFDPDTSDPISVHAYVDGRWSGAFTADGVRNDVGAIFGNGSLHGFQITVSASSGPHQVCLYAINTPSGGTNPQLGCRSVTVTNRTPVGAWDSLTGSSSSITATGWTFDPDTSDPISVHAYVDGRWSGAFTADGVRNDVGAIFGNGSLHGFQITVSASSGPHQVCLYAINTPSGGTNPQLGCRSVTVTNRTPVGAWDSLTGSSSSITATGWTFDPDTSDPISVHAYVDGRWSGAFTADGVRNDVGAIFGNGSLHGFQITVSASSGPHQVCLYAINTPSGGTNPQLGCRTTWVSGS